MAKTFPSSKSYVGMQFMKDTMGEQPQNDDMKYILAVTLQAYLQETYLLSLYQGSKLKKKMRLTLLKKARTITSLLFRS
jgi:hypothetical protein